MKGEPKELLKEQEPIEPRVERDDKNGCQWYACGKCGEEINRKDKFCWNCGKAVKCGAVDRERVIAKLAEEIRLGVYWGQTDRSIDMLLLRDIERLLKEQEPKTGKWILDNGDANSWKCSECGHLSIINDGTPHENDWYFCPCCGAKLKEQEMKWE